MALDLNEFKRAKVVFGFSLEHITFLREEKGRALARAWEKIKIWCDSFLFLAPKRSNNLEEKILRG